MKIELRDIAGHVPVELVARKLVDGFITGLHRSPYHGYSVEFAEHRLYNPGESTRHIDWKVFAKTDRLYTKRYEEETNLRAYLLLDCSPSMQYPEKGRNKLTYAVYASAALAYLFHKQRDAVGMITFDEEIREQTPVKSTAGHLQTLFDLLNAQMEHPPKSQRTHVSEVLHLLAEKLPPRSFLVLFSDMFDHEENPEVLFQALQHLRHYKHEILMFHLHDSRTELDFNFENRPYRFIDLETGEKMKIKPEEYREAYKKEMQHYLKALKLQCGKLGIDFVDMDINTDLQKILHTYLISRK